MYASAGGGRRTSMHTARAARAPSPPPLRDVSPLSKLRLGTAPGPQHGRTPRLGSARSRDKRPRDLSNSREQWHFCRAAGVAGAQGTVGAERGPASGQGLEAGTAQGTPRGRAGGAPHPAARPRPGTRSGRAAGPVQSGSSWAYARGSQCSSSWGARASGRPASAPSCSASSSALWRETAS